MGLERTGPMLAQVTGAGLWWEAAPSQGHSDYSVPSATSSLLLLAPDPDMLVSERSCHHGLWIHESHLHGVRSSMLKVFRRQGRLKTLPLTAQGFLAVSLASLCLVNWSWDLTAQFQIIKSTKSCLKSCLLHAYMFYWIKGCNTLELSMLGFTALCFSAEFSVYHLHVRNGIFRDVVRLSYPKFCWLTKVSAWKRVPSIMSLKGIFISNEFQHSEYFREKYHVPYIAIKATDLLGGKGRRKEVKKSCSAVAFGKVNSRFVQNIVFYFHNLSSWLPKGRTKFSEVFWKEMSFNEPLQLCKSGW